MDYQQHYPKSIQDPETFWAEQAKTRLTWFKPWNEIRSGSFETYDLRWFNHGTLNAAYNCLDRHLATRANQAALIWEGDNPNESLTLTYRDLHEQVCQFANVLKGFGVKKGDKICIYLPMIPEAAIAILACARIGAVHSVVFGGFSAEALKTRIEDADCKLVITANLGIRGHKTIPLKKNVDQALQGLPNVKTVIVVKRTETPIDWQANRDHWYHEKMATVSSECDAEIMDANDPLFILYTSGSTGKPKGILHSTGGYLVYVATTFSVIFDYHDKEIFWCTADVGWITGHSYSLYGPLLNGATTLLFEGVPNYPTPSRYWEVIAKHQVNIFYTAPTAIRALRREGDEWVTNINRDSLRLMGSVGEPINPEAWHWYYQVVGNSKCPIMDTWWQTETGGILISPLPSTPLKAGSASHPFFGIVADIVDDNGHSVPANTMGHLVITQAWPGMMLTVYGDHQRFIDTYFKAFPGKYLTSDQAHRDEEGYFWIAGRSDDVIKVSGHRIGSEEIESALLCHPAVSESAVVSIEDAIKGQGIYAFVTLKMDFHPSEALRLELLQVVRDKIGAIAVPDHIQWAEGLPKTRSGKIMRRLLRKIADKDFSNLGDLTTLADPSVVDQLIASRA